jgi:V/A-type H+-transporting ATPase subunit E
LAIEDIFRALEQQADHEVEKILAQARAQAEAIEEEAREEADAIKERMAAEAETLARRRSSQTVNSARLAAKKRMAGLKGRSVEDVFDRASAKLEEVREDGSYEQLFGALAREALENVNSDYEVLVDPRDGDVARRVLSGIGEAERLSEDLETSGGLVVKMHSGDISRRNTLESRLEKVRQAGQAQVAEILFQDE